MENTHFSDSDIQLASFLVRAKPMFKRISIIVIIIVDVLLITIGAIYWTLYFTSAQKEQVDTAQNIIQSQNNTSIIRAERAALDLKIISTRTIARTNGKYDFVSVVENPNERWRARASYAFTSGGKNTDLQFIDILPGEKRVLAVFQSDLSGEAIRLVFDNISWNYIDKHEVEDIILFKSERNKFEISKPEYKNQNQIITTDRISFSITNQSAFNYFGVDVDIVIYFNSDIIGIERAYLSPFRSGDKKEVEIHSSSRGIVPTQIEVLPHIDIYDNLNYIKVGG